MKISGVASMHAPPSRVWAALTDPEVLAATIPGCERLEPVGPDCYRFTVAAGVASIYGSYTGKVSLSQQQEPSSFVLTATGAGGPGTVSTSVQVTLADAADGTTELSYDADALIDGMIAGVGQRMLSSIGKRIIAEFFSSVDRALAGEVPVGEVPAGQVPVGQVPAPQPSVYPAPAAPQAAAAPAAPQAAAAHAAPAALAAPSAATSTAAGFVRGVLVGVAVTLAGVGARGLIGRRSR